LSRTSLIFNMLIWNIISSSVYAFFMCDKVLNKSSCATVSCETVSCYIVWQNLVIVVPVQSQDLDFQHHMSWFFFCSMIWDERWLFVLIFWGIVDHHCLDFHFIM
jgi:hypothetical protein